MSTLSLDTFVAGALCSALQEKFDVAPETCRTDVLAFLDRLSDAELIEIQ